MEPRPRRFMRDVWPESDPLLVLLGQPDGFWALRALMVLNADVGSLRLQPSLVEQVTLSHWTLSGRAQCDGDASGALPSLGPTSRDSLGPLRALEGPLEGPGEVVSSLCLQQRLLQQASCSMMYIAWNRAS